MHMPQNYFHLAQQAESELVGPQAAAWLERPEREQDNLRATMQWVLEPAHIQRDPELALRLGAVTSGVLDGAGSVPRRAGLPGAGLESQPGRGDGASGGF